jgi:hypothetical protein
VLRKYIPAFLKPIDNLNYDSIFYINLQISTGTNSGFASLKLLLFKPLSFYLPSNNQLKITLNPCKTEGYISTIETTANYVFDEPKQTSASLYPQRIALELIDSPLKSNDKDFENFTGLYDVDRIDLNYKEQFSINFKKEDKACYTSAKINDYLFIEISKAKPMIFEQPDFYFLNQNPLKKEEMDRFFGFKIQEAALTFDLLEQNKTIKINATTEQIYAGGKLATGRVLIPCKKVAEDSYEISNGATKQLFTSQNLKKEWLKNGFTRITTNYNQDQSQLELSFFAE